MEGCAEALIPNPQKPGSALITEEPECLHFEKARPLFKTTTGDKC